jgi:hypothetical protein
MADEPSDTRPISMSVTGPAPVVLPAEDASVVAALESAVAGREPVDALRRVVARHPASLFGWAALGDAELDPTIRYACYRVGYHRGLDTLRANGWRGAGDVRWSEASNRGFLRSLLGLHLMAREIGDEPEAERTLQFLYQLDRSGVPQGEIDAILSK